jgi:hypothetical protein
MHDDAVCQALSLICFHCREARVQGQVRCPYCECFYPSWVRDGQVYIAYYPGPGGPNSLQVLTAEKALELLS